MLLLAPERQAIFPPSQRSFKARPELASCCRRKAPAAALKEHTHTFQLFLTWPYFLEFLFLELAFYLDLFIIEEIKVAALLLSIDLEKSLL